MRFVNNLDRLCSRRRMRVAFRRRGRLERNFAPQSPYIQFKAQRQCQLPARDNNLCLSFFVESRTRPFALSFLPQPLKQEYPARPPRPMSIETHVNCGRYVPHYVLGDSIFMNHLWDLQHSTLNFLAMKSVGDRRLVTQKLEEISLWCTPSSSKSTHDSFVWI
jgi:hypothetical protein